MQTEKITGIKSVDFRIKALGHGVVNWNGPTDMNALINGNVRVIRNHSLPKLRGFSNKRFKSDGTYSLRFADDINFEKTPLYISQNCIRHHLFREQALLDLQSNEVARNVDKLLCSVTGLIRGYVIPQTENKRTSALLLTDFVDQLHNGNFEQMGKSGTKEKKTTRSGSEKSTSLFSKTTFGDTEYEAFGSISIEQLQFIPLDDTFSRQAMVPNNESECRDIAAKISAFINKLGSTEKAEATYHKNYVRNGAIFDCGEAGILLNGVAIDVLVNETIVRLENLSIRQAKGYMYVDALELDYNDSEKGRDMFRIKTNSGATNPEKSNRNYATYFRGV